MTDANATYQLLPDLPEDDYARLKADIAERGVLVAVELDEVGNVLDGHHRVRIANELGVEYPTVVRTGLAEHEKRLHAVALNLARRHLTDVQKVVAGQKIEPDIAERARLRMLAGKAPDPGDNCHQGSDGDRGPRTVDEVAEAVGIPSGRTYERQKKVLDEAEKIAPEKAAKAKAGEGTMRDVAIAVKKAKRVEAESKPVEVPADSDPLTGNNWEIRIGDFRDQLADIEPGTVDLIVTDPPYPKDDLALFSDLAELAKRVLKPRGIMFVWTGQIFLPEVIHRLGEHMTYGWAFKLDMPGANSRIMGRHIIQSWKPVLAYTVGTWPSGEWGDDALVSPERAKTTFEWEQNAAPAIKLIERYTPPNALILDPFTGAGSFGVAATSCGRRFLGVELDPARADKAAVRMTGDVAA